MSCIPKLRDHDLFKVILFSGNLHKQGKKKEKTSLSVNSNDAYTYSAILII